MIKFVDYKFSNQLNYIKLILIEPKIAGYLNPGYDDGYIINMSGDGNSGSRDLSNLYIQRLNKSI